MLQLSITVSLQLDAAEVQCCQKTSPYFFLWYWQCCQRIPVQFRGRPHASDVVCIVTLIVIAECYNQT